MIWRIGCCSSSSPKRSASSTAARFSGSAGNSGGSGWRRSSSRAISSEPWTRRPSIFSAGTRRSRKAEAADDGSRDHREEVGALEGDALVLQHQLNRHPRVRPRDRVEPDLHWRSSIILRCFSRSTSATRRPTSAPSTASASSSTGASRPVRERPATSWRSGSAGLLALSGMALADLDSVCVSSVVPPLGAQYEQLTERYLDAACLTIGPGVKTGMPIRIDNPLEVGADRLVNAVAAYERFQERLRRRRLRHRDQLRRGLRRGRVPRRRDRPRPRDLAQRPDRARRPHHPHRPDRARDGDRPLHPRRDPVRLRLRLRRADRRRRAPDRRGAGRGEPARHRRARPRVVPFTETIDEVDDMLTLKGLRLIHERNTPTAD